MRVVVASRRVGGLPEFAGNTWTFLQYVLGLDRLGVESHWVDHQDRLDPRLPTRRGRPRVREDCHSVEYVSARFDAMARRFGLGDRYAIVYDGGARSFGLGPGGLDELAGEANLLRNLAGPLPATSPLLRIRRRAYVDLDPGFTQIWVHQLDMGFAGYHRFFTVGQNVGRRGFRVPTLGVDWQPTLPPVVLDLWPARVDASCERLSTVGDWRGSQHAHFEGETYTGKRDEFLRVIDPPGRLGRPIEPALSMWQRDHEDLGLLLRNGWCVRDPFLYAGDLDSYREFIQFSRAEVSVAKGGYVRSTCGWFSHRTACYLASGKPAGGSDRDRTTAVRGSRAARDPPTPAPSQPATGPSPPSRQEAPSTSNRPPSLARRGCRGAREHRASATVNQPCIDRLQTVHSRNEASGRRAGGAGTTPAQRPKSTSDAASAAARLLSNLAAYWSRARS